MNWKRLLILISALFALVMLPAYQNRQTITEEDGAWGAIVGKFTALLT